MRLQPRDKRALLILTGALLVVVILRLAVSDDAPPQVVLPSDTISVAEKRLAKLRQRAAALPVRQRDLQSVSREVEQREKGMIQADTPAQAQAQVVQILRRIVSGQTPPIEVKTAEIGKIQPLGDEYGEILLPVVFECRIEQLLNLLASLATQPELLATREMRISNGDAKQKLMAVRLTISAVAPGRLAPQRKGRF